MERNLKRISDALKLSQESRERIRSQLASYPKQSEVIPTRRTLKSRIPLVVAAIMMAMALTLTATAAVVSLFRNNIIMSSKEDIPAPSTTDSVGITSPFGTPPSPLDEMIENDRFKSDDWAYGSSIAGGVLSEYLEWDFAEVLSDAPSLRSRRVGRTDGAEKMEYTAETPANLIDTLTGQCHVQFRVA